MKKRNSLIELYRFIFAINVIKSHGFLPYNGAYLGPGRISVEFFFVLTGFLLLPSVLKYTDEPYKKGIFHFMKAKIKAILIPLLIAMPFNAFYYIITDKGYINLWGYLWYVKQMLLYFIVFFTIRYYVKDEKKFFMIVALYFILCSVLHVIPSLYETGTFRAGMGISLGVMISYLPKLNLKKWLVWIMLIPIQILVGYFLIFGIRDSLVIEEILDLLLFPTLIYLTFQVSVDNKVFNYLGSLSFGLYAFQCVTRPLVELGLTNLWILFSIIVILSVLERLFVKYLKQKEQNKLLLN